MKNSTIVQLYDSNNKPYAELKFNHENFHNFAKHSHQTFGLSIIKKGKLQINYHGQEPQLLAPKQVAVYNPMQVHVVSLLSGSNIPYYNLHIDSEWILSVQRELFASISKLAPISPNIITDAGIHDELEILLEIILNNPQDRAIHGLLEALIKDISLRFATVDTSVENNDSVLSRVEQCMLSNIQNQITIEEIASSVGYNSAHINRLFKQRFGLTLHAFLVDKKVHYAKELILNQNNMTLAQIASTAGFYDQSHFVKAFKKVYSVSPNAYKVEAR